MTAEAAEFPDLPAFRPGAARRAAWRGVLRTSFLAVTWLVAITFVLSIGGTIAMHVLGREGELDRVVLAWQVAHPEYGSLNSSGSSSGPYSDSAWFGFGPKLATGLGPTTTVSFRVNLFGHVSAPPAASFAATRVLAGIGRFTGDVPKLRKAELAELKSVPGAARLGAVVEFASPLSETEYAAFRQSRDNADNRLVFADVLVNAGDKYGHGAYGWQPFNDVHLPPGVSHQTLLSGFRKWVGSLHDSDEDALSYVGVDLGKLRAAARESKVYGVIVNNVTAGYLTKLFDDPKVMLIHPYDIQYAVEGSS
jgi:hypothetical protein